MSFRDPALYFGDIVASVNLIDSFVGVMTFEQYRMDLKTKSAVERQLQIVTEAAIRIGDDAERLCPGLDWRGIRGMGNILRHAYDQVEDTILWDAIRVGLPPLREAAIAALAALDSAEGRSES